jgi:hypothetical protein
MKFTSTLVRKTILCLIILLVIVSNFGLVNASDSSSSNLEAQLAEARVYMSELIINNSDIEKMIVDEDMTYNEAVYYYKLDKMFRYLEKNEIVLNMDNVTAISDSEAIKDKRKTNENILSLDLPSIKQALKSMEYSHKDKENLEKLMSKNNGKNIKKYVYKTSKGSRMEYSVNKTFSDSVNNSISYVTNTPKSSNKKVLAYKERVYTSGSNPNGGLLIGDTEWRGFYGVAYAKIWLNDKIDVDTSADTADVIYVNGSGASYGVFMFQNSTGGAVNTSSGSGSIPAVTSNQVTFAVSGSVGVSIGVSVAVSADLNFSITGGANFTFHVYDKQWGDGDWQYIAGRYF